MPKLKHEWTLRGGGPDNRKDGLKGIMALEPIVLALRTAELSPPVGLTELPLRDSRGVDPQRTGAGSAGSPA